MVIPPRVDEGLLGKCDPLTKWYATKGSDIVLNAIEWRKMYNKCALNNNLLVDAVRKL